MSDEKRTVSGKDLRQVVEASLANEKETQEARSQAALLLIVEKLEAGDSEIMHTKQLLVRIPGEMVDGCWRELMDLAKNNNVEIIYDGDETGFMPWRKTMKRIIIRPS